MPRTRRIFLKTTALGLSAFLIPQTGQSNDNETLLPNSSLPDKDFWRKVRSKFPLSSERVYFNNATMGPSPYKVIKAVTEKMTEVNTTGEYNGWEEARLALANFVAVKEKEISLTHNTTEGINIIAQGLPLNCGEEIIMTTHEHAGNALPWLNRMKQDGIKIRVFKPAMTAEDNLNRINELISASTRVIAVPHITCTTGLVMPVKEIAELGKDKGLWVFFDGAHAPGSLNLNLKEIGCHYYAACCHKWMCGPNGTGFLYVGQEALDVLKPKFIGTYSDSSWSLTPPGLQGYADSAHRFDYGTQSAALYAGVKAAVEMMQQIGMERIEQRDLFLGTYLFEKLAEIGGNVEILTPAESISRSSIVTFRLKNVDYEQFAKVALQKGFRIRMVPEAGINAIRVSTHIYNFEPEIDDFVALVRKHV